MKPDRPLLVSFVCLAAGLSIILGYCHGSTSLTIAYPFSGTVLRVAFTTAGPGVIGGLALTILGALLLIWSFIAAIVSQVRSFSASDEPRNRILE